MVCGKVVMVSPPKEGRGTLAPKGKGIPSGRGKFKMSRRSSEEWTAAQKCIMLTARFVEVIFAFLM